MVKTGNECLLGNYMSSRGKTCHGSLLRGSVVPTKFLLVLLNTLLVAGRDIQRVGCGIGWERSTLRITGRDTAQIERMLMRLGYTTSLDSRLHHPGKKSVCASIHVLSLSLSLVVSASVARTIRRFFRGPYFAQFLFIFWGGPRHSRYGRSRHQSFRVCKVKLSTLNVAMTFF